MLGKVKAKVRDFLRAQAYGAIEEAWPRFAEEFRRLDERARYESGAIQSRIERPGRPGFRAYSQFEEDGVIQGLIHRVPIAREVFLEIGTEDYRESNTRFLLEHDDWEGAIFDAGPEAGGFLDRSHLRGTRTIEFRQTFVTAENVDDLLRPWAGDVGLLSIDIDGNDLWIWRAVTVVSPRIVVIEYQSNFGPDLPLSTPYRPDFDRTRYHPSNLCAGASLAALVRLGREKGYSLVATARHNAFFVRDDVRGDLPTLDPAEAWRPTRFRESRAPDGAHTYLSTMEDRRRAMSDARLVDPFTGEERAVGEWFRLA